MLVAKGEECKTIPLDSHYLGILFSGKVKENPDEVGKHTGLPAVLLPSYHKNLLFGDKSHMKAPSLIDRLNTRSLDIPMNCFW